MILNDWIRGKIPYFVPPPDIGFDEEFESKKRKTQFNFKFKTLIPFV